VSALAKVMIGIIASGSSACAASSITMWLKCPLGTFNVWSTPAEEHVETTTRKASNRSCTGISENFRGSSEISSHCEGTFRRNTLSESRPTAARRSARKSVPTSLGVHVRILTLGSRRTSCTMLSTTTDVLPVPGLQGRQYYSRTSRCLKQTHGP